MELESKLIEPDKWSDFYDIIPEYCKKVVDELEVNQEPIGIGWDESLGWFVMGSGQGPHLIWQEY